MGGNNKFIRSYLFIQLRKLPIYIINKILLVMEQCIQESLRIYRTRFRDTGTYGEKIR